MGQYQDVELDEVELSSERLLLRRWRVSDAPAVQAVMTDHSMHEFLALPDPYTAQVATAFVTDIGHEGRGTGQGLGCAVVERTSGSLVGAAALRLAAEPEVGFWVARAARGHGYAAEATHLLATWGFSLGLHRIRLDCDVRNLASARSALSAGFSFEGVSRDAGVALASDGTTDGPLHADMARFARLSSDSGEPVRPAFHPLPVGGLTDGVVSLRAVLPADELGLLQTEDEVAVGWGFNGNAPTPADCHTQAARSGLEWLVGGQARLAIIDSVSGAFAGLLTVRPGPPHVGALGYSVHPHFRGRRFTTRALRLVARWAFEQAGYVRLELGAKRANVASQRAALAAGFVPDGEFGSRLRNPDGSFSDELGFSLLAPS